MTNTNKTAVLIIQSDQLDWLKKHPDHFANAIASRIEMGEMDKYPGYARWNGDGVPGVQVIWISDPNEKNQTCLITAGNGFGVKVMSSRIKNNSDKKTKLEFLKLFAEKLGFNIVRKS